MLKLLLFVSLTALCCAEIDSLPTTALPWARYEIKNEHPAESTQPLLALPSLPGSPGQSDSENVQTVNGTNQLDLDPYVPVRHALTSKKCYKCRLYRECGPDNREPIKNSCGKFYSKKGGIILTVDLPNKSQLNTVTVCKNSKLNGAKIKKELKEMKTNKKCANSCANFTLCQLEAKSSSDCFQRQPLQMYVSESNRIYDIFTGENMCHNCLVMLSAQVGQQGQVQTRCFPISLYYGKGHDSHNTRKRRSSEQAKPAVADDFTLKAKVGGALNHTVSEKIPIDGSQVVITNNPRNVSFEGVKGSETSSPNHPKTGDGPEVTPIDFNLGKVEDSVTSDVPPEKGDDPHVTPGNEPVRTVNPETSAQPVTTEKDPEPEPDPFIGERPQLSKINDSGNCFKMGKTVLFLIQFVMFFYCL